tara:strand:- start:2191 stop:2445 length:255 start_codon:yes stop_codon:yes gene_type:complete
MEIQINNILNLSLTNDDVTSFVDVFGTLKNAIHKDAKKVGFKKNGTVSVDLSEETIEFILELSNTAGILSEEEIKEQEEKENNA